MDILKNYEIYNAYWKFFRKYAELSPLTDAQWQDVVDESHDLTEPYAGTDYEAFARALMVRVVIAELERINR